MPRAQDRCRILCAPSLEIAPSVTSTNLVRAPRVRDLNTGGVEQLKSEAEFEIFVAMIDRLLHHCHIINIRGNSYRMRHHTELWRSLNSGDSASASSPRKRSSKSKEKQTT